jgi:hypothetical protein
VFRVTLGLLCWVGFWSIPYLAWLHWQIAPFVIVFVAPGVIGIATGFTAWYMHRRDLLRGEFIV